ncbi:SufE family protein [Blattabacterium cuenoti]
MDLERREKEIKKKFESLKDWEKRYRYLIDLGEKLTKKSSDFRSEDKLIHGCQSKVWLEVIFNNNKLFFDADSDALLPKGMAALMIYLYSDLFPYEIVSSNNNLIYELKLTTFLSPIRANGLILLLKKIKHYANYFNK